MKKLILTWTLFWVISLSGGIASANNYPVQPANNGIAKKVINRIFTDPGLKKNTTLEARIIAANSANKLSELIIKSIKNLWIEKDWFITDSEVKKLNSYMFKNYNKLVKELHGDDEKWKETWFHKVVNNGWIAKWKIPVKRWYKKANRVADWIFHLWLYPTVDNKKILNEDWNKNVRWRLISRALYVLLKDDLKLKSWSPKAYYKPIIKKLKKEMKEKLSHTKSKVERKRIINTYKAKIKKLRKQMRSIK